MSKTKSLHHIVFATKYREMTIPEEYKKDLYAFIFGIIRNKKCFLLRMNGIGNHIHLLVDLHPSVALADLVRDVKQWSSNWLKGNPKYPCFDSWGEGYYAVSIGVDDVDACKRYIIGQEEHHLHHDLVDEMERIAVASGLEWHPDDLQ